MVWLDIETTTSRGCSWAGHSHVSNCEFVEELAKAVKSHGVNVGIYSSVYEWEEVMGSSRACTGLKHHPLWYAHYDDRANFGDFASHRIGGWTKPAIKQYRGTTTVCSTGVDLNWYP